MVLYDYPKEIKEAMEIYEPYIEGGSMKEDAPKEAKEAYEKVKEWCWDQGQ